MSETPKDEKPFSMSRAGKIAAGITAGAASVALLAQAGVNANNEANREQQIKDEFELSQEAAELRLESIRDAINGQYDQSAIVGSFLAETDPTLIASAESILRESLGDDVYNENIDRWYDDLLDSAKIVNSELVPQPGDSVHVVEVDLDSNQENGNEYIVTTAPNGFLNSNETLPSPVTN